jgi:hypothetical protein
MVMKSPGNVHRQRLDRWLLLWHLGINWIQQECNGRFSAHCTTKVGAGSPLVTTLYSVLFMQQVLSKYLFKGGHGW